MSRWHTICPINPAYNSQKIRLTQPVDLGCGVNFTIVPMWLSKLSGIKNLGLYQTREIGDAQYILISTYKANFLGDIDFDWQGKHRRSKQDTALEKIQIANLSMWLSKPSPLGFRKVLYIEECDTDKFLRGSSTEPILVHNVLDKDSYLALDDFTKAKILNVVLHELKRDTSIWMAVRTLWQALTTPEWAVRFLFLWIALEAIFGANTEIQYRISHRVSFFLASDKREASEIYNNMKISYDWRSKAIHGMRLDDSKKEESLKILYNTEKFIRIALVKILNDSKLINIFSDNRNKIETYLDNLIFV